MAAATSDECVFMEGVALRDDGVSILEGIDWSVRREDCWVVLGANGSGKTALLRTAACVQGPSEGTLRVLGETYGRCDVRRLRVRIGFVSAASLDRLRPELSPALVVMTGKHAALEPWWDTYDYEDRARALELLQFVGCESIADRSIGHCSEGERKRVLVARALMPDPELLLLDEPCAGLDLRGREDFLSVLADLAADPSAPPCVFTTHHLEEIPPATTHALVLRGGTILAQGTVEHTVTSDGMSQAFGVPIVVERTGARYRARIAS